MPSLTDILASIAPHAGTAIGGYLLPGVGAGIGNLAGQGLGSLLGYLNPQQQQQQPMQNNQQMDPARQYLMNQLMQQSQFPDFDSFAQRERGIYENQIVPRIAERFAGAGALSSSGFRQALAGAGGDLQERLNALRTQHEAQRSQLNQNRLGLLGNYLTGQGQLGLKQQEINNQRNDWLPTLSTLGSGALGLGSLAAGLYNNAQNRSFQANQNALDRRQNNVGSQFNLMQQLGSFQPGSSFDIQY